MSRARILVVDDEPDMIHLLQFRLSQDGYDVHTAEGGEEALRRFKEQKYDLIFLDCQMPNLSGPEVLSILHRQKPDQRVILMTGGLGFEDHGKKCEAFIKKPIDLTEMASLVRKILQDEAERGSR